MGRKKFLNAPRKAKPAPEPSESSSSSSSSSSEAEEEEEEEVNVEQPEAAAEEEAVVAPPEEEAAAPEEEEQQPVVRRGKRRIELVYIGDKNRRGITFSKRKQGLFKKAHELTKLTGSQVLCLVTQPNTPDKMHVFNTSQFSGVVNSGTLRKFIERHASQVPDAYDADDVPLAERVSLWKNVSPSSAAATTTVAATPKLPYSLTRKPDAAQVASVLSQAFPNAFK